MMANVCLLGEDGNPVFFCPGCGCGHKVWVKNQNEVTGARWEWNKRLDLPTFAPSIRITTKTWVPPVTPENMDEFKRNPWKQTQQDYICHSFVRDGNIEFCSDSTHRLAGKTVALKPF